MRVTISVGGKFQAFNLAQQLLKKGFLERLITSYPKFEVVKYGIPRDKIRSIVIKELLERGWRGVPESIRDYWNPQYVIHEIYDRLASGKVGVPDIFTGWSSFSLHSLRKVKKAGPVIVLERGSSHIGYQNRIMREEFESMGVKIKSYYLPHPKIIEKELQEYEAADYIAVPSSFAKRSFLENGIPESKIIQVPYGVDLSIFRQLPKKDDIFRIIFGGGLSLRKGVHYLLKAFSELRLSNAELLLVGPVTEEIEPFLKLYQGKFKRIDYKPFGELGKCLSQGSVFVMPSIEEGLAMVQPIAMACGLPLICTTNTGGEDIIRDGIDGFVIPIRDVGRLKEKILYMYENQEFCKKMGQSAKERVSSGFTWDDYGEKMINHYKRILKIKHGIKWGEN